MESYPGAGGGRPAGTDAFRPFEGASRGGAGGGEAAGRHVAGRMEGRLPADGSRGFDRSPEGALAGGGRGGGASLGGGSVPGRAGLQICDEPGADPPDH